VVHNLSKLIAGVSAKILVTAPNVVRRSGVPPATYISGNGGACQDLFSSFSSAEEAIANAKMDHIRSYSPICGGYEYAR
jgi:hypothetical protein